MFLNLWRRMVNQRSRPVRCGGSAGRQHKPAFKPRLEVLEERTLLSVWRGGIDNNWSTPGNWIGGVPGPGDTAVFDSSSPDHSVVDAAFPNETIGGLSINYGRNGAGLTVNRNLTLTGLSTWDDSGISVGTDSMGTPFTLTNSGTLRLEESLSKVLDGRLTNAGTIVHTGTGFLLGGGGGFAITNSGTYDFQTDATLSRYVTVSTFTNSGIVKKSGGLGQSFFYMNTLTNNGGTFEADSGALELRVDTVQSTGAGTTFTAIGTDSIVDLMGGTSTFTGYFTGSGNGQIVVGAGVIQAGTSEVVFDFPEQSQLLWTTNPRIGGNYSNIDGGTNGVRNQGWIKLTGPVAKYLGGTLRNEGHIIHTGTGSLGLSGPSATLDNTGEYDLQAGDGTRVTTYFGNPATFNNAGILKKR
jgi:hypothetical protein